MSAAMEEAARETKRTRALSWVIGLALAGLVFDGYDLVVYGTCVSTFLRDPAQIGAITPATAGRLGSYALFGVLVGALAAGSVGDIVGRRRVMLIAYAWFSVGMAVTALTGSVAAFGAMRFVTGLGIGALVGTTAALVSECAPPGKKNVCNAIVYSGVPVGSLLAAALAILLMGAVGWRGLFMIGALPLVTLFPLACLKLPESAAWLAARGRIADAHGLAARGIGPPDASPHGRAGSKASWAGLFASYPITTFLVGFISATGLTLVYALNIWLPELMLRSGFNTRGSLSFLIVLNGGAVAGALMGGNVADRFGAKRVVAASFAVGAAALALLTAGFPVVALFAIVAFVGLGSSGTQTLIYGLAANLYRTNVRGAGVAWCAGFGRLGGIGGPLLGGFLTGGGFGLETIFYALASVALLGSVLTTLVPSSTK